MKTNWKTAFEKEVAAHEHTRVRRGEANENVFHMQNQMWAAQRAAQADRNRYEESERGRIAAQKLVDELQPLNARLQAERDLLLTLVREFRN